MITRMMFYLRLYIREELIQKIKNLDYNILWMSFVNCVNRNNPIKGTGKE